MSLSRTLTSLSILAAAGLGLGCGTQAPAAVPETLPVVVGAENVLVAAEAELVTGPALSGSLEAETQANVRAEVGGAVLSVHAEEGQPVERGALLARIDDAPLRDPELSARSALTTAEQQLAVARRNAERAAALLDQGAIAPREEEDAAWSATAAESAVADARARLTLAREQLGKATVRSPLAGVVSRKAVAPGDTVLPGSELYTVVDPTDMRLRASVAAERLAELAVGAPVTFTVKGYPGREFAGDIERINPVADSLTRQVEVYVTIPNAGGELVAGLFAEGRVGSTRRRAVALPESAIDRTLGKPSVIKVVDGKAERMEVTLGIADEQAERVEVTAGVDSGDVVLTGAAKGITPGTPIELPSDSPAAS